MSFALEENEPFPAAVTRLATEQIDMALCYLLAPFDDIHKSVHATRQSLKRIRALLALARNELSDKVFVREWACYRDVGRLLGDGRDAAVVVETLDALVHYSSSEMAPYAFGSIRRFLENRRDARLSMMIEEGVLEKASETLAFARERLASWHVRRAGFKALAGGLRRTYRAGREGLRTVVHHPSSTNFHEWRQPVKLLWHQLQILTPIWPVILNAYADELKALSDRLNNHHDLYTLRHAALWSQAEIQPTECHALITFVDRRCRELEAEGLQLGERLYTERPRRFTARLEHYWQAWRWESAAPGGRVEALTSLRAGL